MEKRQLAPPNQQLRTAVRWFYAWIGSTVLLGLAPIGAMRLIDYGTLTARVAAVVVGAGSVLPWLWVVAAMVRRGDEFIVRIHLIAVAWAFAGAMVLLVALSWLVRADFIAPPDLLLVWLGCLVLWVVALLVVKRRFERDR